MQNFWQILVKVAIITVSVSGQFQNLGRNNGINIRVNQRGLSYAVQKATIELYNKYRNEKFPDFIDNSDRKFRYEVTNINVPSLSMPTVNLQINPGQGVSSNLHLGNIKITGNFRVRYKLGWFWISKSGRFTVTAGQIVMDTALGVGREGTGRPTVAMRSCNSNIGSFNVDIHSGGIIGWVISRFEGTIGRKLKARLIPMMCKQVGKMITEKVNPELKEMKVSTKLQDNRLVLDYALLRPPTFGSNYIDTTFKGDVSWKGRATGTPASTRSWPSVPNSKMVTIYITDYFMNALGALLHNDGSLSYNVTREKVSSTLRKQLRLTCPNEICAGSLFPDLAEQYPDGWVEAGLRTNRPPQLNIRSNLLTGNFFGIFELYVRQPSGQRTRVAVVEAQMTVPLFLNVTNNMLKAHLSAPRISITSSQANNPELKEILDQLSQGFTQHQLEGIGQKGFELPSFKKVAMVNPQIHLLDGVIAISTDVNYTG